MSEVFKSFVFKGADAEAPIDTLAKQLGELTASGNLGASYEFAGVDEDDPNVQIHVWKENPDERAQIRLAQPIGGKGRFVTTGAPTAQQADQMGAILSSRFSFFTVAELVEKARQCSGTDAHWIAMMAHAAGERHDPEVQKVIEAQLRSNARSCREQAAIAAGILYWPELLPALRAAHEVERDDGIRWVLEIDIEMATSEPPRQ